MLSNTIPDFYGLLKRYGDKLSFLVKQKKGMNFHPNRAVLEFLNSDPCKDKTNVEWLIQRYIAEDCSLGEIRKLKRALILFELHNENLAKRNISDYTSISEFKTIIEDLIANISRDQIYARYLAKQNLIKKVETAQAFSESRLIVDTPEFQIVTPLSHFAECYFGHDTFWPWAYNVEKQDMFTLKHPTFYILINNEFGARKFFLSVDKNRFLFLDEYHKNMSPNLVGKLWVHLEPLIRHCNQNGNLLHLMPSDTLTVDYLKSFAEKSSDFFTYLGDKDITEELCRKAFEKDARVLKILPRRYITQEMCLEAIKQYGFLLKELPKDLLNYEICEISVSSHGRAIGNVPDWLLDRQLCKSAQRNYPEVIKLIPKDLITYDMYKIALQQKAIELSEIPLEVRTRDICLEAFVSTEVDVNLIKRFETFEFYEEAVTINPRVLQYIPTEFKTSLIYEMASRDLYNFPYLPKKMQTYSMQIEAVKYSSKNFHAIDNDDKTQEMCLLASREPDFNLADIPVRFHNAEISMNAVVANEENIVYVKRDNLTPAMCKLAVEKNGSLLRRVPIEMMDLNMVADAYRQNARYVFCAPENLVAEVKKEFEKTRFQNSLNRLEWDVGSLDKLEEDYWEFFQSQNAPKI